MHTPGPWQRVPAGYSSTPARSPLNPVNLPAVKPAPRTWPRGVAASRLQLNPGKVAAAASRGLPCRCRPSSSPTSLPVAPLAAPLRRCGPSSSPVSVSTAPPLAGAGPPSLGPSASFSSAMTSAARRVQASNATRQRPRPMAEDEGAEWRESNSTPPSPWRCCRLVPPSSAGLPPSSPGRAEGELPRHPSLITARCDCR